MLCAVCVYLGHVQIYSVVWCDVVWDGTKQRMRKKERRRGRRKERKMNMKKLRNGSQESVQNSTSYALKISCILPSTNTINCLPAGGP